MTGNVQLRRVPVHSYETDTLGAALLVVLTANSQNLMIFSAVLVLLALNQGHCTRKLGRRPHMWYEVGLMQSNITTVYTI